MAVAMRGVLWQGSWEDLFSEPRCKEKSIPYEQYRAERLKRPSRSA